MTATSDALQSVRRTMERLRRTWSCQSRPVRLTLVLATAALGVAFLMRVSGLVPGDGQVPLLQGLRCTPAELRRMEIELIAQGIERAEVVAGQLLVPGSHRENALRILAEADVLPAGWEEVATSRGTPSLFASESERQARERELTEKRLEHVLRRMDGVSEAMVMIGCGPQRREGIGRVERDVTTSVSVRLDENAPLTAARAHGICQVVAAAVDGLSPRHVTVLDLATSKTYHGEQTSARMQEERFAELKLYYERQWVEKLQRVLGHIPGIQVVADVQLAPIGTADDTRAVLRAELPGQPGLAGEAAAVARAGQALTGRDGDSPAERAWRPWRVSVTVSIPRDYLVRVWRARHDETSKADVSPDEEYLARLRRETEQNVERAVGALSPLGAGVRVVPEWEVVWFDRPATGDGVWESHAVANFPAAWPTAWNDRRVVVAVVGLLAVIGVALLWGVVRDTWKLLRPQKPLPTESVELRVVPREVAFPHEPAPATPGATETAGRASDAVHPGLTELVREDPQAAVAMLKNWLDKAG